MQKQPVQREVALKIIKFGMDTREVVRRFEAERQALAMMEHPNIAAVHDAGTTPTGRPYFVMELVRGFSITAYCDARRLPVRQRLELFVQVCRAVQHAHQKGIIHRDLKPSNILVVECEGRPLPKIIDFGIVKATGPQLTSETLVTRAQEIVGTPAYMSPEQASLGQIDIDTRSDIYSLGVLLYELLTGRRPFDAKKLQTSSLDVSLKTIREEDPRKPSTQLANLPGADLRTIAELRQCEFSQLPKLVRGDLDWIVMKALDKERARRYDSAIALAEDIERFLNHEAVSAAAPSALYQLRKFARRHRTAFAASGAVAAILIVSAVLSAWLAVRATQAERRMGIEATNALRQASIADAVKRFLTEEVFSAADPMQANRLDVSVREMLDKAAQDLNRQFPGEPLVEAEIRATVARIYSNLGDSTRAFPQAARAFELRQQELGDSHRETLRAKRALALLYFELRGQKPDYLAQAEAMLREALETSRPALPEGDEVAVDIMSALATVLFDRQQFVESRQLVEQALGAWTNAHGLYNPRAAHMIANFAGNYALHPGEEKNRMKEQWLFELALDVSRQVFGEKNPYNVLRLVNLGTFYMDSRQLEKADGRLREAVALAKQTIGNTHPLRWSALRSLMQAQLLQTNLWEATALAEEELALRAGVQQPGDPALIDAITRIGNEFENHAAADQALEFYRKAITGLGAKLPADARSLSYVTYWMVAAAQYDQALEALRNLERFVPDAGPDSPNYSIFCRIALLEMIAQGVEGHPRICERLLGQFETTNTPQVANDVARICLLVPKELLSDDASKLDRLIALVRESLSTADVRLKPWFHLTLGMERYRAHDWDSAIVNLNSALRGSAVCQATAQLFLALTHQKRGQRQTAKEALIAAEQTMDSIRTSKFSWWHDYLLYRIAVKEARKAVDEKTEATFRSL